MSAQPRLRPGLLVALGAPEVTTPIPVGPETLLYADFRGLPSGEGRHVREPLGRGPGGWRQHRRLSARLGL